MNTCARNKLNRTSGITLIECLVYIGVATVVTAAAMASFYQCWTTSKGLRRNADDVVQAVHAGERWRADLRAATGTVRVTESDGAEQLHIPAAAGEIVYTFAQGKLRRQNEVLLTRVKSSQMRLDARPTVAAWRWELELQSVQKKARLRPLFTFETVPGNEVKP